MSAWSERISQSAVGRWYASRDSREQPIILAIAGLVVAALLWIFLWQPVSNWQETALVRAANAQAALDYIKANEGLVKSGGATAGTQASELVAIVTRAARAEGLTLNRVNREDSGTLSVILQGQPFDQIFAWIAHLERNNGLQARYVSFRGEERVGFVNAQVRFQ